MHGRSPVMRADVKDVKGVKKAYAAGFGRSSAAGAYAAGTSGSYCARRLERLRPYLLGLGACAPICTESFGMQTEKSSVPPSESKLLRRCWARRHSSLVANV